LARLTLTHTLDSHVWPDPHPQSQGRCPTPSIVTLDVDPHATCTIVTFDLDNSISFHPSTLARLTLTPSPLPRMTDPLSRHAPYIVTLNPHSHYHVTLTAPSLFIPLPVSHYHYSLSLIWPPLWPLSPMCSQTQHRQWHNHSTDNGALAHIRHSMKTPLLMAQCRHRKTFNWSAFRCLFDPKELKVSHFLNFEILWANIFSWKSWKVL
jgi:hypothetical protein